MSLTMPEPQMEIFLALHENQQITYQFTGIAGPLTPEAVYQVLLAATRAIGRTIQQREQAQYELLTTPQPSLLPEAVYDDESTRGDLGVETDRSAGEPVAA